MKLKLQFASLLTLGLLSGFVAAIILAASFVAGFISWQIMIGLTILFNFLSWLIGPYISDLMYKWFYKISFYNYDELKDYPYMKFIKKVCDKHKIKVPKIGIIKDQNPTAFTYGSAAFNARIVLTDGLFKFLNEDELEAVIAHEIGHIVNKDFIIMSIASTLLQVLYQIYVIFTRSSRTAKVTIGKKGEKKGSGYLVILGYVSLLFYYIGTYIVLFLSRLREYYADEFSAKETGAPEHLSSALIKIGYGIASAPDTEKTAHLLNNTRAQGIMDFKSAKEIGLVYLNSRQEKSLLEKALLFDLVSPWAFLNELSSTHPLIGKRISRLSGMSKHPHFKFDEIKKKEVDKKKLWDGFFLDLLVLYSYTIIIIAGIGAIVTEIILKKYPLIPYTVIAVFLALVLASVIRVQYRFPSGEFKQTDVINCMADIYASPVRGKRVKLSGKAIGRGQAGFIFGEDMIFQDKSGIIYLNYESGMPVFGNLLFAWKKLESLLNKDATAAGWFFRGATHHIELKEFNSGSERIRSYAKFWYIAGMIVTLVVLGAFVGVFLYFTFGRFFSF